MHVYKTGIIHNNKYLHHLAEVNTLPVLELLMMASYIKDWKISAESVSYTHLTLPTRRTV